MAIRAMLAGLLLAATAGKGATACDPGPPDPGNIQVCVLQDLAFGTVTEPSFGPGTVTVTPEGERYGSQGVDPVPSQSGGFHPAEILLKGEPGAEFELSFSAGSSGLSSFTSDIGTAGTLNGNGERLVRVGATFTISGAGSNPSGSFSVTATLVD